VPVFAVNFGEVGFLATVDPDGLSDHFARAFAGDFETIELPTIAVGRPEGSWMAMNDVSVHRKPGHRVADLAYGLAGEEIGRVRCDGIVVATPQGSTGYNLANGGPVMAWGVEGYVVSFVAPHSLTARALVIAPGDLLTINNASREEPVEVHVDGRPSCELPPGEDLHVEFALSHGTLAQLPGASFYHRLRERFGRLAR
jgi:NAD+ kinase